MTIPHAHTPRADTGVSNAQLGMWLFLASDIMLMASLLSGYVLLRTSAATVPAFPGAWMRSLIEGLLLLGVVLMVNPRLVGRPAIASAGPPIRGAARTLWVAEAQALLCAGLLVVDLMWNSVRVRDHVLIASWFVLVAAHLVHVVAGLIVTMWLANRVDRDDAVQSAMRLSMLQLYWVVVTMMWIALLIAFRI